MKLHQTFTLDDLPVGGGQYDPLPPGWYQARIVEAVGKTTKAGTGEYIAVRYDITGPSHQGRVVYGNINHSNPSAKAEQIGRQQLGELMRAIGLSRISDTDELVGGVCEIKVDIRKGDGQYADSNEIKAWKAVSGAVPSVGIAPLATAAPGAATQAALSRPTPPWQAKK